MKFINILKDHINWIAFGFILCALTPALMVALGITLMQALYLAFWAIIIFCAIALVWMVVKTVRNDLYWRKNH